MANFFSNKDRAAAAASGNGSSSKAPPPKETVRQQPWVEKYRPKTLDDVTAQDHTVQILQRTLQSSNLPHMLFYGPPGTGKTSTILALARSLYGPALFSSRVLELNASDERGISIVREKVKNFARAQLSNPPTTPTDYTTKYPCPPYKIIILDEADSMTQDAQSALRRTMETYSRITRFVLCCNYVTRIIDPLASRCSKFRFKSMDTGNAKKRLEDIAKAENVTMQAGAVEKLIEVSEGDLRRSITFLQSCARLSANGLTIAPGSSEDDVMEVDDNPKQGVTKEMVEEIAGTIPDSIIDKLVSAVSTTKTSFYEPVAKIVNDMICDGWSATQTITQLYAKILYNELISNQQKNKIVAVFSEIDKRLVDGADEHLEILDLSLRIAGILSQK